MTGRWTQRRFPSLYRGGLTGVDYSCAHVVHNCSGAHLLCSSPSQLHLCSGLWSESSHSTHTRPETFQPPSSLSPSQPRSQCFQPIGLRPFPSPRPQRGIEAQPRYWLFPCAWKMTTTALGSEEWKSRGINRFGEAQISLFETVIVDCLSSASNAFVGWCSFLSSQRHDYSSARVSCT